MPDQSIEATRRSLTIIEGFLSKVVVAADRPLTPAEQFVVKRAEHLRNLLRELEAKQP
jgi:hypothetical protein